MEAAAVAAQQAMLQSSVALSVIKKNAEMQQQLVSVLAQAVQSAPTGGRGQHLDISV